ncbi:hypothetical protein [Variovorax sp. KK3]|uniref:hypothetical protein n=1 Tax=Variovorax sp. KK3 TaxID=1855728 RepID=UPI00097C8EF8|nr:hypothetical protein [Variovorax sp. KK3]
MASRLLPRFFLPIALSLACLTATSGTRPTYRPFDVKSANKQFTARVFVADKQGAEQPWQWRYRIQVISARDQSVQWERDFLYNGHPGGDLSDDGLYFAEASSWYRDSGQLVSIYHAQGQHHFSAADLRITADNLEGTKSQPLWLHDVQFVNADNGSALFVLETVQGARCIRLRPAMLVEPHCAGE